MFDVLVASGGAAATTSWPARLASVALHGGLIAAVVGATAGPTRAARSTLREVPIALTTAPPPVTHAPPTGAVTASGVVSLPDFVVPTTLPPIDLPAAAWTGTPDLPLPDLPGGLPLVIGGQPGTVLPAEVVDERRADEAPVLLHHPVPHYPEVLRQAGVEGRVMVEVILDTLGRAEPGSLRVVRGAHALFDREAQTVVLGSRYRAARVAGRAVRVRIQVPVAFSLAR